jgi:hypothetical protein
MGPPQKDCGERCHEVPARIQRCHRPRESGRVTNILRQRPRLCLLVERKLEQDGYDALKALVSDNLHQATLVADVHCRPAASYGRAECARRYRVVILKGDVDGAVSYEIGHEAVGWRRVPPAKPIRAWRRSERPRSLSDRAVLPLGGRPAAGAVANPVREAGEAGAGL